MTPRGFDEQLFVHAVEGAMVRTQDANLAATEITKQGQPTRPQARKIAERQLDYYFELVEADLNYRRKLQAEWSRS
jgi:uncharacterized protein YccT (UPF0319 family)